MSKLILSVENMVILTFELDKERITIGRKPENDIQVDNLAVSGQHAVVTTMHNDSVIEDLNSTNGTLVNGQAVQKHLLRNNDVIDLGKHRLKFIFEAATASSFDYAKTMVIRRPNAAAPAPAGVPAPHVVADQNNTLGLPPGSAKAASVAMPAAPAVKAVPRDAALQIIGGAGAGRVLDLNKNLTTIGKPGVQVAVFTRRPSGFFMAHVEGKEFPLLNGKPLGAQAQLLSNRDMIEIAGIKLSFSYKP